MGFFTRALSGISAGSMRRRDIASVTRALSTALKEHTKEVINSRAKEAYLRSSNPFVLCCDPEAISVKIAGVTQPLKSTIGQDYDWLVAPGRRIEL